MHPPPSSDMYHVLLCMPSSFPYSALLSATLLVWSRIRNNSVRLPCPYLWGLFTFVFASRTLYASRRSFHVSAPCALLSLSHAAAFRSRLASRPRLHLTRSPSLPCIPPPHVSLIDSPPPRLRHALLSPPTVRCLPCLPRSSLCAVPGMYRT